jgi:hypothetical protein
VAPSTPQGQLSSFSPNARNRRFMGVFAIKGPRKSVGWALRKHLSQTQEFHRQRLYQRNRLEEDGTCRRVCEERGRRADVSNRQMNRPGERLFIATRIRSSADLALSVLVMENLISLCAVEATGRVEGLFEARSAIHYCRRKPLYSVRSSACSYWTRYVLPSVVRTFEIHGRRFAVLYHLPLIEGSSTRAILAISQMSSSKMNQRGRSFDRS